MEKIIQTKTCTHCQTPFDITDQDLAFYDKISPTFAGKKYQIPSPTLCPDCRQQRRLSFRNERKLYKRKCDLTGKDIVSIYLPDKPFKVYEHKARWSDQRDPLEYGVEFDFSKSFFQQWKSLYDKVPKICLNGHDSNENSPYTNYTIYTKNSYFNFGGGYNEDTYYNTLLLHCKHCVDSHLSLSCEQCYEVTYCNTCYNLHFSNHCEGCRDSYFLEDCNGCEYCFACSHLDNAKYYVFNKEVSKQAYEEVVQKFLADDPEIKKQITDFFAKVPYNQRYITRSQECVGHNIKDAKNCVMSFNIQEAEDLKYCNVAIGNMKDCYDIDQSGINFSLCYEFMTGALNIYHTVFSFVVRENSQYLTYCGNMSGCTHCFGCIGLKNKSYCILNKQYTKEEYEKLVPQIIEKMRAPSSAGKTDGERGEFFPLSASPFGYNETVANEFFPLNKQEALAKGFQRSDYENTIPKVDEENVVVCEVTGRPFRLIPQEIEFYKKHNLHFPTKHPDVRHLERMKKTNPRKLRDRTCDKCGIAIKTSYNPDRPEKVYCETCYNKEIYG